MTCLDESQAQLAHLAQLAWQGGNKPLQLGWWPYVSDQAEQAGIARAELLSAIELLKSSGKPKKGGD